MKRYYNSATNEWHSEGRSMTRRLENGALFSGVPSEGQLKEWGFVEWVEKPVSYNPSREDVINLEIYKLKLKLTDTDYIALKAIEGYNCDVLYPNWKEERASIREKINELEYSLNN